MAWVYRYTDLTDNKIKYVGIVYGKTRTLQDRINEHKKDKWYKGKKWLIEYISEDIDNQSEAEAFESHFVALFNNPCYNIKKVGWGINKYLPDRNNDWIPYSEDSFKNKDKNLTKSCKKKVPKEHYQGYDTREYIKDLKYSIKDYKDRISLLEHIIELASDAHNKVLKPMTILNPVEMTKHYFDDKWNRYGIIATNDQDGDLTLSFTSVLTEDSIGYAKQQISVINSWVKESINRYETVMDYLIHNQNTLYQIDGGK